MSDKYKNLKVKELQERLQKAGLPHTGKKEELIDRLVKHDESKALELESLEAEFGNLEDFDESHLDDLGDAELKNFHPDNKEKSVESSTPTVTSNTSNTNTTDTPSSTDKASTASTTTTATAAPTSQGPITKEGSGFTFNPIVFDKKPSPTATTATTATAAPITTTTTTDKPTTDAERKLERAKRFGVQVNEKTKQEMRAARFGTNKPASPSASPKQSPGKPSSVSKGIDPEVLRKRAERFGIPDKTTQSPKSTVPLSTEEEEKKRKRAERFGLEANKKTKI